MATPYMVENWSEDANTVGQIPAGYTQNSGGAAGGITVQSAPSYFNLLTNSLALRITTAGYRGLVGPTIPGSAGDDTWSILFGADTPSGSAANAPPTGSAFLYFDQTGSDGYYLSLSFDNGAAKIARNSGSPSQQVTIPTTALLAATPMWIVRQLGPAAGQTQIYVVRASDGYYLTTSGWQSAVASVLSLTDPSPITAPGGFQFAADTSGTYWIPAIYVGPSGTPSLTASPTSVADGGTTTLAPHYFTGAQANLSIPANTGTLAGSTWTLPATGSGSAVATAVGKFLASETATTTVSYGPGGASTTATSASVLGLAIPVGTIGQADRGSVALLGGAALSSATTVNLVATGATVPSTVVVPAGAYQATFPITPTAATFSVTATAAGLTGTGAVAGTATQTPVATLSVTAGALTATPSYVSVALSLGGSTGGTAPLCLQFEQASDSLGSPGPWANIGTAGTATTCIATGLIPATKYWFRALVQDSTTPIPLVAATAAVTSTTLTPTAGSTTPPTIGSVSVGKVAGLAFETIGYSVVPGSLPIGKVELFVTSATTGGNASIPLRVDDTGMNSGCFYAVARNSNQYLVKVSDTANPPNTASVAVTGNPPVEPLRGG